MHQYEVDVYLQPKQRDEFEFGEVVCWKLLLSTDFIKKIKEKCQISKIQDLTCRQWVGFGGGGGGVIMRMEWDINSIQSVFLTGLPPGHMSEQFFQSNRPGYLHPVSSELENSGIRVAVSDCSVTERWRWQPPYQTGQTVHVQAKHYKHNEDGHTGPGVCGNGSLPLSHSGNVVTRIGIHTHTYF